MDEEIVLARIDELSLDLNNFRFASEQPDESLAFNYLFSENDAMAVVRSLLAEGYLTNEVPLVVKENGRYVVLEANRRVSALRAIKNSNLLSSPTYKREVDLLVKRYQTEADALPNKIYVSVFPDRSAAAPVLARLHIGENKRRWGLDEQAKFVMAQIESGSDVRILKDTLTGIKDVVRLVKMANVRKMLEETDFQDESVKAFAVSSALKMSAFEYAYKDRHIRDLIGLEFDRDGNLVARPAATGELAVLEAILQGFKSGELSTRRVLNNKRNGVEYSKLIERLTALKAGCDSDVRNGVGDGGAQAEADSEEPSRGARRSDGNSALSSDWDGNRSRGQKRGPNEPDKKRLSRSASTIRERPLAFKRGSLSCVSSI